MNTRAQRFDIRQSMKNRQFEIFHYRDKKLENVGVHHHEFYEVYFFLSGNVNFRIEGRNYHMESGDLLLINPRELHQVEIGAEEMYERIVLWIDRNYLSALGGEDWDLSACFNNRLPSYTNLLRPDRLRRAILQDLLEKLNQEFYGKSCGNKIYAQSLLMQFLVEINRMALSKIDTQAKAAEPDLISQVVSSINSRYQEKLTLEKLAEEFYVSKYYLSHEFSRRVGTSVYRYITFRRLMSAKELMEEGHSPVTVYQSCGFGDYANFYRAFKAEYGISPKAWYSEISS